MVNSAAIKPILIIGVLVLAGLIFLVVTVAVNSARRARERMPSRIPEYGPRASGEGRHGSYSGGWTVGTVAGVILAFLVLIFVFWFYTFESPRELRERQSAEARRDAAIEQRELALRRAAGKTGDPMFPDGPTAITEEDSVNAAPPDTRSLLPKTTPAPRPPQPPQPPTSVQLALPNKDDFLKWKESDVLAPETKEKPWVASAAGSEPWEEVVLGWRLRGRSPGPGGEIVGYSGLEPDADLALQVARQSAARQIKCLLIREVRASAKDEIQVKYVEKALERLDRDIVDYAGKATIDSFEQEITRDYGKVHRAAVLVQAGPEKLQPLVKKFQQRIAQAVSQGQVERQQIIVSIASALALALVVFLIYAFVNAGTKGHFAWPLRIISIGTLIVLYLGLMYMQGWFPR